MNLLNFQPLHRLCVNTCNAADMWANCRELYKTWPGWLCRTNTTEGLQRQHNCLATCNCQGKIHDWVEYGLCRVIRKKKNKIWMQVLLLNKWNTRKNYFYETFNTELKWINFSWTCFMNISWQIFQHSTARKKFSNKFLNNISTLCCRAR